jgi:N-acetylglutamate synthase-like GNAT family acetyltransferase
MQPIEINTYSSVYKNDVADLVLNIQQQEFNIPITLEDQPDLQKIEHFFQSGNGNFWVATIDNNVIGTIALADIGNQQVALRKMFVKEGFRGAAFGAGQALLNTVFEWSKEKHLTDIFLGTTEKYLAAHRFYEKNGFTEIKKTELPKAFPVMQVDNKFYHYPVIVN